MTAEKMAAVPAADASAAPLIRFQDLALADPVLRALQSVGYESPSPIQAATIPPLLDGRDMLGQAQTGTGKTAAFALPILSKIDLSQRSPQALVLAPTRELAIQVAEAFQRYASELPGFHVLPIYGGQAYGPQLASLKRGVHVIVGTPGRVMDHMKRGTLKLDTLRTLVLDEADEMLRMGFIDDVEWVLQQTPPQRQVALFSATMPSAIRRIAQTYLRNPAEITIKSTTATATNIRQRYWLVSGTHKLDALTRILEAETFDGIIIFARTKQGTVELAEKLEARGYAVAALNGDMEQKARERVIARLKDGQIDIVVATDIAARGLDVERVSLVVNYDIPTDPESYVHRIGRTGRAGRSGDAILFIAPRERHLLRSIERTTRKHITPMELPTVEAVSDQRISRFKQKITDALAQGELTEFRTIIEAYEREHDVPAVEIAAALARLVQGEATKVSAKTLSLESSGAYKSSSRDDAGARPARSRPPARGNERPGEGRSEGRPERVERAERAPSERPTNERAAAKPSEPRLPFLGATPTTRAPERPAISRTPRDEEDDEPVEHETYRIEVGHVHGVQPGNIVGAIANEADLESRYIGRIDIREDHTFIDLPSGMPKQTFRALQKVWVSGQQLRMTRAENVPPKKVHSGGKPKPRAR